MCAPSLPCPLRFFANYSFLSSQQSRINRVGTDQKISSIKTKKGLLVAPTTTFILQIFKSVHEIQHFFWYKNFKGLKTPKEIKYWIFSFLYLRNYKNKMFSKTIFKCFTKLQACALCKHLTWLKKEKPTKFYWTVLN